MGVGVCQSRQAARQSAERETGERTYEANVSVDVKDAPVRAGDEELGLDELLDCDHDARLGLDGDCRAGVLYCLARILDLGGSTSVSLLAHERNATRMVDGGWRVAGGG